MGFDGFRCKSSCNGFLCKQSTNHTPMDCFPMQTPVSVFPTQIVHGVVSCGNVAKSVFTKIGPANKLQPFHECLHQNQLKNVWSVLGILGACASEKKKTQDAALKSLLACLYLPRNQLKGWRPPYFSSAVHWKKSCACKLAIKTVQCFAPESTSETTSRAFSAEPFRSLWTEQKTTP